MNKAENIEDFFQPVSDKANPGPVLITAYVPDTQHRFSLFAPPLMIFLAIQYIKLPYTAVSNHNKVYLWPIGYTSVFINASCWQLSIMTLRSNG